MARIRPGDRVAVLPHIFCGSCFYCLRGRQGLCSNLKLTGVTWPWGGLAGQAIVHASQVRRAATVAVIAIHLGDRLVQPEGWGLARPDRRRGVVVQDLGHPADPGSDRGRDAPGGAGWSPAGLALWTLEDIADQVVRPIMTTPPIVDRATLTQGFAGVPGSFLHHTFSAAERFGVDARDILVEVGRWKSVGGQEDLVIEVAARLAATERPAAS